MNPKIMAERCLLREMLRRWRPSVKGALIYERKYCSAASTTANGEDSRKVNSNHDRWLILPPFSPAADGSSIGKALSGRPSDCSLTSLKWILKCCPHLPRSFVQKLFRLRQVRKECFNTEAKEQRPRRVGAKDPMDVGDRILLPKSADGKFPSGTVEKQNFSNEKEMKFVCSLELYKDQAIIVLNKPPGMPVQGGLGIKKSLDELASKYLRHDYSDSPRLVHRLDRDSSGILVMGRTQLSATILHSIFREKTFGASIDVPDGKRVLHKRYWALVIGSPRRQEGLISVPLVKVVVDDGKSERITVADHSKRASAQLAVTQYRVMASSSHGFSWLELSPLTGRKHQLRVHCAEVLGTPIVGDYKYGWKSHKRLGHSFNSASDPRKEGKIHKVKPDEVDLELESGSISDKRFRLHLHCKEMILPNISLILQDSNAISNLDTTQLESIELNAPLPAHMQRSWDLTN